MTTLNQQDQQNPPSKQFDSKNQGPKNKKENIKKKKAPEETLHKAVMRWQAEQFIQTDSFEDKLTKFDLHLMKIGKQMSKKYPTNVYKLNKCALLIQHWFFKRQSTKNKQG